MPDHTPEHKEQTQQGGMGGQKQGDWEKQQGGQKPQGDYGQPQTGGDRERREESERLNA